MTRREAKSEEIAGFLNYDAFLKGSIKCGAEGRVELPPDHPNGWKSQGAYWILEFDILAIHFHFAQEECFILKIDGEVDRRYLVLSIKQRAEGIYHVRCLGKE